MEYEQIWLTGFMATGKSRVSRPLAAALDWDVADIDTMVEAEAHDTIPAIFGKGGEGAFRALESQIVERVAAMHNVVVATGGGTILSENNREAMRRRGFVVCLDARPETISSRIADSGPQASERPLLSGDENPLSQIIEIKGARQSLYAQADFIIQTDELTPDQVTHQVLLAYRERTAVAGGTA